MADNFVNHFAEYIRNKALGREGIDSQYPDDRNARTVAALRELAPYVESLGPEDRSIAVIGGLWDAQADNESIGAVFDNQLSRFRFNDTNLSCEEFLKNLAQTLMEEFQQFYEKPGDPYEEET